MPYNLSYPDMLWSWFGQGLAGLAFWPQIQGGRELERKDKKTGRELYLRCFGEFEVLYEGEALHFPRKKAKEALAFLVDKEGKTVTNQEICEVLWPDVPYDRSKQRNYFHHLYSSLKKVLDDVGCGNILVHTYDSYAVDPEAFRCDFYEAKAADGSAMGQAYIDRKSTRLNSSHAT